MNRPLCFVLMPFGKKPATGASGMAIDFDAVYRELIKPALDAAGLEPIRADDEQTGGVIQKPMFERLILCEYAVADLTNGNANVFYELGLRHAVKPATTVPIFAAGMGQLPFDVSLLRGLPYQLNEEGKPKAAEADRLALVARLQAARDFPTDSPVFQMVEGFPDIQRLKTDVFRERVRYSEALKGELALARKQNVEAVRAIEAKLGNIADADSGVVLDLYLSYRAVKAWDDMIDLVKKMSPPLAATVMVQEQLGLALNRTGRRDEAERVLLGVINKRGPSSESYGILGRVYKDQWEAAGTGLLAEGLLDRAIEAYLKGFEADWRDAYPGINAVTLMELKSPPDPRREKLIPVVTYAVERRIAASKPDYWDYATLLELAVLGKDKPAANKALTAALANVREVWEPETTVRNLRLIREARDRRGETVDWALQVEEELLRRMV